MPPSNISDVRLIGRDDPGFRAFVARERAERVARSLDNASLDTKSNVTAAELLEDTVSKLPTSVGRLVESAVRQWLGCRLKLECNCILTWRELVNLERRRRYAELDFVHRADYDSLVVFEIKFITEEWMLAHKGIDQLNRAERILQHIPSSRNVLKRLVYVGDGSLQLPPVPAVDPGDVQTPLGVIWVDAATVESVSAGRGTVLPDDWRDRPRRALHPWLRPEAARRGAQSEARRVA
jgi:hypothetical protein